MYIKTSKIQYLSFAILMLLSFTVFACAGVVKKKNLSRSSLINFGSIHVNGSRNDSSVSETEHEIGIKINSTTGAIERVDYEPEVEGKVISINIPENSINILGQTVFADSTTVFKEIQNISEISVGNNIEARFFIDSFGNFIATYIALETDLHTENEIEGTVSNFEPENKKFIINSLIVDYNNVKIPPINVTNGSFIEAKGSFDQTSNTLFAVSLQIEDIHALEDINPLY